MECDLKISNPEILDTLNLGCERSYPTPYSNSPLLPLLILTLMRQGIAPRTAKTFKKEYDYIVVGAGAGGSAVAARLSEEPCVNVLLLEAGKAPPVLTDIPAIARSFIKSDIDWKYCTVPQKNTGRALINRQSYWPSGKALGGSSVFSGLIYERGNRMGYDHWAAQGAKGWSANDVRPYFLKLEDNWDLDILANGFHSIGGPVAVQRPGYCSEIKQPLFEVARLMGLRVGDSNGAQQTGFSDFQGHMGGGQRCNTAEDYLVPVENRTNLDILPNAHVTKVIMDGCQAVGVQFDHKGSTFKVRAKWEVILSAGSTNTPQLLMLSGIGPKEHLEKLKIPVVVDLPVGNNFHDHPASFLPFQLDPAILTVEKKLTNLRNLEEYISNRTGPLSSAMFISTYAYLPGESSSPLEDDPAFRLFFAEISTDFWTKQTNIKPDVYKKFAACYDNIPKYFCFVNALKPRSRGTIRLKSKNPYDAPLIDPNYFDDPRDIADVVEGLKVCQRIGTSEPMARVGSKPFETLLPGCEHCAGDEDRYLECLARSLFMSLPHGVGSAKMGDPNDPSTVVDPELRVKGVKGLRVVDASIMPTIPVGSTYVPTVMIGEKAADIIKETIYCSSY
ncbi:glucose dehydrogenase [FAD, quinone]-like [Argiope bruennichi]|uniref:glucose dehydrogenase [FAD, quinone]-like n=1 Tax=Argiope bruennichi TaxID=94029 RepID=UPI002493F57C|nr:glucose dehydrogenase [FAD, quinone]-like [Argiope bruennichi]